MTNKPEVNKTTGEVAITKPNVQVSYLPSRTKQAMRKESDINYIVARSRQVGHLPLPRREPIFGDISNVPSYVDAFNLVTAATEAFQRLPAALRDQLGHDPKNLFPFLADERNREAAEKFGLLKKRETPKNDDLNNDKKTSPDTSGKPSTPPPPPPPVS